MRGVFLLDTRKIRQRCIHGRGHVVAHLHVDGGWHKGAEAAGVLDVELEARLVGRKEPVRLFLIGDVDRLVGVGEEEGIEDDHDREIDGLGQFVGLQRRVDDLLAVLAV